MSLKPGKRPKILAVEAYVVLARQAAAEVLGTIGGPKSTLYVSSSRDLIWATYDDNERPEWAAAMWCDLTAESTVDQDSLARALLSSVLCLGCAERLDRMLILSRARRCDGCRAAHVGVGDESGVAIDRLMAAF
jgi:hypothetical protein